jgi:hypothetical protein
VRRLRLIVPLLATIVLLAGSIGPVSAATSSTFALNVCMVNRTDVRATLSWSGIRADRALWQFQNSAGTRFVNVAFNRVLSSGTLTNTWSGLKRTELPSVVGVSLYLRTADVLGIGEANDPTAWPAC